MFRTVDFGRVWHDQLGSVEDSQGISALAREQYGDGTGNSGYLMRFFQHNQNDEIQLGFQLDHDTLIPGEGRFHIHVIPMALPVAGVSDQVRYRYHYAIAGRHQNFPRTNWTTGDITQIILPSEQYQHIGHSICTIPLLSGLSASSIIFIRLTRLSSDPADTYKVNKPISGGGLTVTANLAVVGLDIHVQRSRAGTRTEYV